MKKIMTGTGARAIFALLLVAILVCPARGDDNEACFGCHQDEGLSKLDAQGQKVSLSVSQAEYAQSIHGKLSCSDCHEGIRDDAHAAGGKQAAQGPAQRPAQGQVNCGGCHEKEAGAYRQSLHAKAIVKGAKRAAHCYDCHGKHAIYAAKDPQSMINPTHVARTCNRCHSDKQLVKEHTLGMGPTPGDLFKGSIHATTGEVTCSSCHGSHDLRSQIDPKSSIFRSNIPHTCGECHPEIMKEFEESIHGVLAARGRSDSPTCTTCHGIHGIKAKVDPESPVNERRIALTTCPQCHAAERISKEYGITRTQVKSYYDSFHGLSYRGGDTFSANCASCHGVHDIRSSSDPKSMIHRDNLQKTCGACHPGASANFARGKIHAVASIKGEELGEKIVGWVRVIYIVLIAAVIGGMTFFNFSDWLRKTIERKPS